MTSVTVPEGVTALMENAFDNCPTLATVNLPSTLTSIGEEAFLYCYSLQSITIPPSVIRVDPYAFQDSGIWYNAPSGLFIVDGWLCGYKDTTPPSGNYTVPNGVRGIADYVFCDNAALTGVTFPDSVKHIGASAFSYCENLVSVTWPQGLVTLGDYAFGWSGILANVPPLPASVEYIGEQVFDGTAFWDSQPDNSLIYSGSWLLGLKGVVTGSVAITPGTVGIAPWALAGCWEMTDVSIPSSVKVIGLYAFYGCGALQDVTLPAGITRIEDGVFCYCGYLTNVTVLGTLTHIGDAAFHDCYYLQNAPIPPTVTSIGHDAFSSCLSLTSVIIPPAVRTIGDQAFRWCEALTDVTLPCAIIGTNAFKDARTPFDVTITPGTHSTEWITGFYQNGDVKTLTVLNGVTSIGASAFRGCTGMTDVTLAASVQTLGSNAFNGCNALTAVYFKGNAPGGSGVTGNGNNGAGNAYIGDIYTYSANVTNYVTAGSTGWVWDNPGSTALPNDGLWCGRAIAHGTPPVPEPPLKITRIEFGNVSSGKRDIMLYFEQTVPIDYNDIRVRVWEQLGGASTLVTPPGVGQSMQTGEMFVPVSVDSTADKAFFRLELK